MCAANLLVIGSGVNATSLDDALLQHKLSVDNFIVYGHFGVHRVITLYANKNKLGFIRATQKTCMDRATTLLVISSGPLSPENRRIMGWAHAKGVPVLEHDVSGSYSSVRMNLASNDSSDYSSEDDSEDDHPLRDSLSSGELPDPQRSPNMSSASPKTSVYSTCVVRAPPPIARYDSDVEISARESTKDDAKSATPVGGSELEASHNSDSDSESDSE
jgi:hypothetical protein